MRRLNRGKKADPVTNNHSQTQVVASPAATCIAALAFMIIGVFVGLSFGYPVLNKNARASENWPNAKGIITYSAVQQEDDSDGEASYSHDVRYTYDVGNHQYQGAIVYFGEFASSNVASHAREIVDQYPVAAEVIVFYDTEFPGTSCLQPGVEVRSPFLVVFGIGFFVIGVVCLCSGIRRKLRNVS